MFILDAQNYVHYEIMADTAVRKAITSWLISSFYFRGRIPIIATWQIFPSLNEDPEATLLPK